MPRKPSKHETAKMTKYWNRFENQPNLGEFQDSLNDMARQLETMFGYDNADLLVDAFDTLNETFHLFEESNPELNINPKGLNQ